MSPCTLNPASFSPQAHSRVAIPDRTLKLHAESSLRPGGSPRFAELIACVHSSLLLRQINPEGNRKERDD
jgi:hypothetical protein